MDPTQLLLTIILTLTTVLLLIVGFQLFFVLREIRKLLAKLHSIANGFEHMGQGMNHGFTEVIGFVNGIKTILKIADQVTSRKNERSK